MKRPRSKSPRTLSLPMALLCGLSFGGVHSPTEATAGEEDLVGEHQTIPETADASRLKWSISGLMDMRLTYTGDAATWWKDGPGLTRYGALTKGGPGGPTTRDTALHLSRLSLVSDLLVRDIINGHFQFNFDDHPASTESHDSIGLVEAYIAPVLSDRARGRAGILIPPLSLEHFDPAWTSAYTITPSALNTWVGEELKVIALEGSYEFAIAQNAKLTVLGALFSGNDPAGSLLAWRGWALHDYQLKTGDRYPIASDVDPSNSPNGWTTPFKEIDGRPGIYAKIGFEHSDTIRVEAFYFNSFGDPTVISVDDFGTNYSWKTKFSSLGMRYRPHPDLTVVAQGLYGSTEMGPLPQVKNDFFAWYGLLSYQNGQSRFSVRYDRFKVMDRDATSDQNDQDGYAETVAYFFRLTDHHLVGAEYVHPVAIRPGNTGMSQEDAFDDLFQLSYRLTF